MAKIDELIEKLCPNGVEYKMLSEVCITLQKETLKTNELLEGGKYPVINSGREFYGMYNRFNNEKNAFTFAARGEYAGFISYLDTDFWAGGLCYPYRSKNENKLNTKFIYYYLKNKEKYIMEKLVSRGSIPAINKNDVDKIVIPIPPLEIQGEIVRVLDKFTELSNELSAELKVRHKQYEYYRGKLLSFDEKSICTHEYHVNNLEHVEYRKLEECCNILDNKRKPVTKSARVFGEYPYYGANGIQDYVSEYIFDGKFILVGEDGSVINENGNPIVTWAEGKIWVNNHAHIIEEIDGILLKYLFYYLQTINVSNLIHGNIPKLNQGDFRNLMIVVPSLSEQERIVNILDKFEKLCNDITEGIPAEIEARQKQYEYYRDKLLTFKELKIS